MGKNFNYYSLKYAEVKNNSKVLGFLEVHFVKYHNFT